MNPTKLTHSERLSISEKLRAEMLKQDSSGFKFSFENFSDISVILEYDSTEKSIVLSFKIENISTKVPYDFIGCPTVISGIETVSVKNICDELETVLHNEYGWKTDISSASFTVYDWEDDTAWYLYEEEVSQEQ